MVAWIRNLCPVLVRLVGQPVGTRYTFLQDGKHPENTHTFLDVSKEGVWVALQAESSRGCSSRDSTTVVIQLTHPLPENFYRIKGRTVFVSPIALPDSVKVSNTSVGLPIVHNDACGFLRDTRASRFLE
jgi:hypothetical protein